MRVLVAGGRTYSDWETLKSVLDKIHKSSPITVIIQGGAKGADYLASYWANLNDIKCLTFKADWDKYGPAAGPIRNNQMLDHGAPDLVVIFPGTNGTKDMLNRAKNADLMIIDMMNKVTIRPVKRQEESFADFLKRHRYKGDDSKSTDDDKELPDA